MPKIHYLAYGSNLHPLRLKERVPSAHLIGTVPMPGYKIAFHKRSADESGKCLLYQVQDTSVITYGALFEFDGRDKPELDRAEGKNKGYIEQLVQFSLNGVTYTPYLYMAQSTHIDPNLIPYDWYKNLVLAGARYHNLPVEYISAIEAMPCKSDENNERRLKNEQLLKNMGFI